MKELMVLMILIFGLLACLDENDAEPVEQKETNEAEEEKEKKININEDIEIGKVSINLKSVTVKNDKLNVFA